MRGTIPVNADQAANRRKKGSKGARVPSFDQQLDKQRLSVECGISGYETSSNTLVAVHAVPRANP
jgi:hypothetical protein